MLTVQQASPSHVRLLGRSRTALTEGFLRIVVKYRTKRDGSSLEKGEPSFQVCSLAILPIEEAVTPGEAPL